MEKNELLQLPFKQRIALHRQLKGDKIRAFYRMGYSMNECVEQMRKIKMPVSKSTVFFAIHHRYGFEKAKKGRALKKR